MSTDKDTEPTMGTDTGDWFLEQLKSPERRGYVAQILANHARPGEAIHQVVARVCDASEHLDRRSVSLRNAPPTEAESVTNILQHAALPGEKSPLVTLRRLIDHAQAYRQQREVPVTKEAHDAMDDHLDGPDAMADHKPDPRQPSPEPKPLAPWTDEEGVRVKDAVMRAFAYDNIEKALQLAMLLDAMYGR